MVHSYKGKHDIDNWTSMNYLQYVQSMWDLRTSSMLQVGYPTLLTGSGMGTIFQAQDQHVTTRSPRIETVFTKCMYMLFTVYHYINYRVWWVISVLAILLWVVDV